MTGIHRLAITTGDTNGIGPEVATKALLKIKPQKNIQMFFWRSPQFPKLYLNRIDRYFRRQTVRNWADALKISGNFHYKNIIDIESSLPPAKWVETMGRAAHLNRIDGLVTAPLSKTSILQAGLKDIGHTQILKRTSKSKDVFMTFLGKNFNVVLLTGHVSLKKAYDQIDERLLESCIKLTSGAKKWLKESQSQKDIALVGCNPHAGELGSIDTKEEKIYKPVTSLIKRKKIQLAGPLVPDVCFQSRFWKHYSYYIASYHDQGLIPFKMAHEGQPGVQVSLGLPYIRTSVDHGTAKDIFGKNKADEESMKKAIEVAIHLLKKKVIKW